MLWLYDLSKALQLKYLPIADRYTTRLLEFIFLLFTKVLVFKIALL